MSAPFVDTSVIIRLLTGDDPHKQAQSKAFFQRIEHGGLDVVAPATVIADAVYVLASPKLYRLPREQVAALLLPLVRLPAFHVQGRRVVLAALQLYGATPRLDFGDALIATSMQQINETVVYAYDTDFDRIPGITRREPED
jgi:predicted nucleic acid-binding protein